jgi:hypothetical protein
VPARRRRPLDPRARLARLVDRLSQRRQYVTFEEIERAAARPSSRLAFEELAVLVEGAVAESLLLKDLRTFFDRQSGAFTDRWVYRVNARHPVVAELLDDT